MKVFLSRQFILFLITGGFAAFVNFFSRILYNVWFDYSTSIVIAYLTGMITAYVLARVFVFTESTHGFKRSALFFTLVNVIAIAQTWGISMIMANYALPSMNIKHFVPEIAHAAGIIFPVFTSYLGHKYYSFR